MVNIVFLYIFYPLIKMPGTGWKIWMNRHKKGQEINEFPIPYTSFIHMGKV